MADLFPTKTRLELLRAVVAGRVYGRHVPGSAVYESYVLGEDGRGPAQKVTSRMTELHKAGWVSPHGKADSLSFFARRQWELTDAGRKVLEEADRADG